MKKFEDIRYSEYLSTDGGNTVYAVYGEDPNCDFGGTHHNPFLGNVEGTFKDVIEYAVNNMAGFYQWGVGGYAVPLKKLQESSDPIIANSQVKLKKDRKAKLEQLSKVSIVDLIDNIDSMSKNEIKKELIKYLNYSQLTRCID